MADAVVMIDFVNDIVHPKGAVAMFGTPAHAAERGTIAKARSVLAAAREREAQVIWVRVCFSEDFYELEGVDAPFYNAHRRNGWLVRGTWGTEFHSELQPLETEPIIEKARINPFTNPEFEAQFHNADRVVLLGVSTNLAVEETVRNAAAKGFKVVVLEDCCASNNAEMHDFSVTNIISKFAEVSSSDDYLAS